MELPFFATKVDESERSKGFWEDMKMSLKRKNTAENEDEEEVDDQWLEDVIQSVMTDGQRTTYKLQNDTCSKRNKGARGDVRSLFVDPILSGSQLQQQDGDLKLKTRFEKAKDGGTNHLSVPNPNSMEFDQDTSVLLRPGKNENKNNRAFRSSFSGVEIDCRDGDPFVSPTLVHHLGPNDLLLLRTFADTEILTVFRTAGGIKFECLQSKRKPKDVGVFGLPLQALLDRDLKKNAYLRVPLFVSNLISLLERHVNEEGILRIPGSLARIKETVQALESDDNYMVVLQYLLPHDLSGLLKQFLRDLPAPILTLNYLDAFCKALSIKEEAVKLHAYQTLICLLPDVNRATLQLLLGLLDKICKHPENKMGLDNVTMSIGPTIFLVDPPSSSSASKHISSQSIELDSIGKFIGVTHFFLSNFDKLWAVPALLLKQIRQFSLEKEKGVKLKIVKSAEMKNVVNALKEMEAADKKKRAGRSAERRSKQNEVKDPENNLEMVLVHSHHPDFHSRFINITASTSVADVLLQFNKFRDDYFLSYASLFEVGGATDHRMLNPSLKISLVLKENPRAKFHFAWQSDRSLISSWPIWFC